MDRLGRYRIERIIGRGAMGVVYRATDPAIGRSVAIKVLALPPGIGPREADTFRRRFVHEARAAGALLQPNVVAVHDVGSAADGTPYLVMELCEGGPLSARLSGALPDPGEVARHGAELARALEAAHAAGILHRDVKPSNLLFGADGRLKIADFGVARLPASELTSTGSLLGSPAYMSPEQVSGKSLDARSDVFSLAAVLYRWLTGRLPHEASELTELLYRIAHEDPLPASTVRPEIPTELDRALLRGLARDRDARYPDARSFAEALEAISARERSPVRAAASRARAAGLRPALLAAGLAALVLGSLALRGAIASRTASSNPAPISGAAPWAYAPAEVRLLIRHRVPGARAEVLVDGGLASDLLLSAPNRKKVRLFGKTLDTPFRAGGEDAVPLAVPPGQHAIGIRLQRGEETAVATLEGRFESAERRTIVAEVRRSPLRVTLRWSPDARDR